MQNEKKKYQIFAYVDMNVMKQNRLSHEFNYTASATKVFAMLL